MKLLSIAGIVLIIFGVFAPMSEGISYTKTEEVPDIGSVHATVDHKKTIPILPIAGGLIVAAGVLLVVAGTKRQRPS